MTHASSLSASGIGIAFAVFAICTLMPCRIGGVCTWAVDVAVSVEASKHTNSEWFIRSSFDLDYSEMVAEQRRLTIETVVIPTSRAAMKEGICGPALHHCADRYRISTVLLQ